jgi:hypothetical protein
MTTRIVLVRATQTCMATPSQWDAWDGDGNYYYLRYRSGYGEIRQYASPGWVDAPWIADVDRSEPGWALRANPEYVRTVATFEHGDPLDGEITLKEFAALAGVTLSPELMVTGYGDHLAEELILEGVPVDQALEITESWRQLQEDEENGEQQH